MGARTPATTSSPVGRLAPSPTGLLHLGHARSFLLAWWSARARGGGVRLRLEDLDAARVRAEYVESCLSDLEWLGLDWDGPVRRQSEDTVALEQACEALVAAGRAYPCVCTRAEIAAVAAPHAGELETRYPGTCSGRWASASAARADSGREPALRLGVEPGPVEFVDALHGPQVFDVEGSVGDFPIRRRDGVFAYQLAVVVDDHEAGVTEVLRGDDLLPSTARQLLVQRALGLSSPAWVHVPLVLDAGGDRLAKRRDSFALARLREAGADPRAVVAWAARSAGQEVPALARADEVRAHFDLARLPEAPAVITDAELEGLLSTRV